MIFYCTGTGKLYKVKTLKSVSIGGGTGYAVDTYEALPDAADLSALSNRIGDFEAAADAILGEES